MSRRYRVLIVGAGVAGLAAAISLRRAGHDVLIFERAGSLQPLGAGLVLWSNAVNALRALGLEREVRDIGHELRYLSILDDRGSQLTSTNTGPIRERTGSPVLAVHRAELLSVLADQLPPGILRTDHELIRFDQHGTSLTTHFADGASETGDVLIGADGIRSAVRSQIHGERAPRYAGYTAWRAVSTLPDSRHPGSHVSTESWGNGLRFGWVPLSQERVYWFAVKNAPKGQRHGERGHREELLRLFGHWHSPIPETIHATEESQILRHDIYDHVPVSTWGTGAVTLAGDAAHPMTPNTGQGAAQAIEDAVELAYALGRYRTIEGAMRAYEARRISRTNVVVDLSRRLGDVAQISHPLIARARNALVRATPDRIAGRQLLAIVDWTPPPGLKQAT